MKKLRILVFTLVLLATVISLASCMSDKVDKIIGNLPGVSTENETQAQQGGSAGGIGGGQWPGMGDGLHIHRINVEEVEATCSAKGFRRESCLDCGEVLSHETYELVPHKTKIEEKASTCAVRGYKKEVCQDCGKVVSQENYALAGHDLSIDEKPATCMSEGFRNEKCYDCNYTKKTTLPKTDHVAAAPATETQDSICKYCSKVLEKAHKVVVLEWKTVPASSISWAVDGEAHIMYIKGTGVIPDFGENEAPWNEVHHNLRAVVIDEGITRIGKNAFRNFTSLLGAVLPKSLTSIGSHAFFCCSSMRYLTIPANVTEIDIYAFSSCTGLKTVTLNSKLTKLSSYLFYNCSSLSNINPNSSKNINFPTGVTEIGKFTFYGCARLDMSSAKVPSHIKTVGTGAFQGCGMNMGTEDKAGDALDKAYKELFSTLNVEIPPEYEYTPPVAGGSTTGGSSTGSGSSSGSTTSAIKVTAWDGVTPNSSDNRGKTYVKSAATTMKNTPFKKTTTQTMATGGAGTTTSTEPVVYADGNNTATMATGSTTPDIIIYNNVIYSTANKKKFEVNAAEIESALEQTGMGADVMAEMEAYRKYSVGKDSKGNLVVIGEGYTNAAMSLFGIAAGSVDADSAWMRATLDSQGKLISCTIYLKMTQSISGISMTIETLEESKYEYGSQYKVSAPSDAGSYTKVNSLLEIYQ